MSNFSRATTHSTEFEGDTVTMSLHGLKRKHMMMLGPYMPSEGDGMGAIESMKLLDVAAELLPDYVSDFKGLKDENGNALGFEDVVDEMYFIELISDIMSKLFDISNMGAKDAKNSRRQPSMSIDQPVTSGDIQSQE